MDGTKSGDIYCEDDHFAGMKYDELGCQGYCQNTILDSTEKKYDSKNSLISSRHVVHTYRGCADGYD